MDLDRKRVNWFRSLRFKLVAAAIAVEIVMLSVLLANSFRLLQGAMESQTQTRLEAISPLLDAALAGRVFQRDYTEVSSIINRLTSTQLTEISYLSVFDQSGQLIAASGSSPAVMPAVDTSVMDAALGDLTYDVRLPLTILDTRVGTVNFGLSLASMVSTKDRVMREGVIIALAEIILSLILLASGGYLITRHLYYLADGARRIANGDYDAMIKVSGSDEISMLGNDFNLMAMAVSKNIMELRTSEMRVQAIFDAVGEAIFIHDADNGIIVDVNRRMCQMFNCSREQVIGTEIAVFCSNSYPYTGEVALEKIRSTLNGTPQTFEWQARSLDGKLFWVEVSLRTALIGTNIRMIAVVRDISERKNEENMRRGLEKQLHQAQRLESIGIMAGGVAHDLNNIISGIVGYPELILAELPEDSKFRKPLMAIHESGKRAAVVVADMLTVARCAASTRENCDIHSLVREYMDSPECLKVKQLHPDVKCEQAFTAIHPVISCSPVHIKKCLMNLVTNAAEAVKERGFVVISTRNEMVGGNKEEEWNIAPGEYVVVSVKDTGSGISEKDKEHIFEPFYTRKVMGRSGTGLGLTVVWNTVQDHDGMVLVESGDTGTLFQLYFPVSTHQGGGVILEENQAVCKGRNEHILVVDDEPQMLDIAERMLKALGYKVDTVCSGEDAIEFVRDCPVDLMLIDMLMAPGINGYRTYEEILEIYPEQKAVIVSGYSESDDAKSAMDLGAGAFMKKPYLMKELGQTICNVLHG